MEAPWFDTYYQYRLPVTVTAEQEGWHRIPLTAGQITRAINQLEDFHFDATWFAWNHLVVVSDKGKGEFGVDETAGFFTVPAGPELFTHELGTEPREIHLPTIPGELYLATYTSRNAGESPFRDYRATSHETPLLPKSETNHEVLILAGDKPLAIRLAYPGTTEVTKLSVRRVRIEFLANFDSPGAKQWTIYYQPMCANYLHVPRRRSVELPASMARMDGQLEAEKRYGGTRYRVAENSAFDAWFAESTVKITPGTSVPGNPPAGIRISGAKGEAQSFQIIINPRQKFVLKNVVTSDLRQETAAIEAKAISVQTADYVPIHKKTLLSPTQYTGLVADALVDFSRKSLDADAGNHVLWLTVRIPRDAAAGAYKGQVAIECDGAETIKIPLELTVYDFALPEFSPLRTNVGGQFFFKADDKGRSVMAYHGMTTKEQYKKLAKKYYDVMAENKFYPKSAALFSEIGMNWSPPPQGYNVDLPGNYFQLHDWDFTEFNADMKHYIDDLKVNTICLTHTNPTVANLFKYLPGKELDSVNLDPPHISMSWQYFREHTYVEWNSKPGDAREGVVQITRDQFDHLNLDFYRAIAKNLQEHGWLERFIILVDETANTERIEHFVKLLKSDPLTAQLRIVACMQSFEYLQHQDADGKYPFNGLITYMPQIDEDFCRWADHFAKDYSLSSDRDTLWFYAVGGSRLAIDAPGINNRILGFDLFARGASGFHISDTIWWDWPPEGVENPWVDPTGGRWGNGAYSYFYPPRKDGPSPDLDYTVIPSVRVMTFREAVDDYEYAWLLEQLIARAQTAGKEAESARLVLADIRRTFANPVHWSQNDAWLIELRDRVANSIVQLQQDELESGIKTRDLR